MGKKNNSGGLPPLPVGANFIDDTEEVLPPLPNGASFIDDQKKKDSSILPTTTSSSLSGGSNLFLDFQNKSENSYNTGNTVLPLINNKNNPVRNTWADVERPSIFNMAEQINPELTAEVNDRKKRLSERLEKINQIYDSNKKEKDVEVLRVNENNAGEIKEAVPDSERSGNRATYLYNKALNGVGEMAAALGDVAATIIANSPNEGYSYNYRYSYNTDYIPEPKTPEEIKKQKEILTNYRKDIAPMVRSYLTERIGSDLDKGLEARYDNEFLTSTLGGLANSIPAMLIPGGAAKGVAFVLQGYDGGMRSIEANDPNGEIDDLTKSIYATSVGTVNGLIEKFGFDKILGPSTSAVSAQIANRAISEAAEATGGKITGDVLTKFLNSNVKQLAENVSKRGVRAFEGFAIESATGGTQEIANIASEYILNEAKGKPIFDTEDASMEGFLNNFKRVGLSAIQEGIGGGIIRGILNPQERSKLTDDEISLDQINQELDNTSLSPESIESLVMTKAQLQNGIENTITTANNEFQDLRPNTQLELSELNEKLNKINTALNDPSISPEINAGLLKQSESITNEIFKIKNSEKTATVEYQTELDNAINEFQTKFPDRNVDPLEDLPNSVVRTFDRVEDNVPTDIVAVNEASDWLYNKYKQLTEMKDSDSRILTIEQINSTQDQLSKDIELLENFKTQYYGDEQSTENKGANGVRENASPSTENQTPIQTEEARREIQPETKVDQSPATDRITEQLNEETTVSEEVTSPISRYQVTDPDIQASPIEIEENSDGTFTAFYEEGASENYSREGIKNVLNFDPETAIPIDVSDPGNEFQSRLDGATNPEEVAAMYDEQVIALQDTGSKDSAIAAYLPSATQEEFARYNDGNNMNAQIRLQYTPIGNSQASIPLDTQAQEINNTYFNGNDVVTPNDIAAFMQSYPNGAASYTSASGNETLRSINQKYKDLTGKNLRKDTARKLADKYRTSKQVVDAAIEEVEATSENIAAIIDRDIEFADGFSTPAEIKDSWLRNLNQYSEDPQNEFNLWYPVFKGKEITEEQFNNAQNLINERTINEAGSPGGNQGPDSGSDSAESVTTDGETGGNTNTTERSIADRIRSLKSKPGQLYGGLQGVSTAVWDGALETLATAIEAGQSVLNAIERAVDYIKSNSSVTDTELIESALRDDLHLMGVDIDTPIQPVRDPGESIPDFALRLAQWRQYNLPNLNQNGQLNQNTPQANVFNNNWILPEERKKDKLVRKNVDFLNRLDKAESAIKENGATILPEDSAYMQFQLLSAKTAKKISDAMSDVVVSDTKNKKSLFQRVKDAGFTISEFGLFTYAQHAKERNDYVAELRENTQNAELARLAKKRAADLAAGKSTQYVDNRVSLITRGKLPDFALMPDGGSGMTNKDAADILGQFDKDGKTAELEAFAAEYRDKVTRESLLMQYQNGLVSDTEYQNITNRYKNYVPLQVEEYVKKGWASNVKNIMKTRKAINRTKGSDRTFNERVNPVLYGVVQYEKATIEASKNEWLTTLKNMVINHPNDDVWMIQKPTYIAEYNKDGSVKNLTEKTPKEIIDQSVKAFDNGKPYYIQLKDEILRRAVRQDGFIKDPTILKVLGALNSVNSVLRNVNTLYNPNFIMENFVRDTQEASFQLSGKEKGIKRKFLKNIPSAIKGIVQHRKGDRTSPWAQEYEEYVASGAEITFADQYTDIERLNEIGKQLEKMSENKVSVVKAFRAVKGWMDYVGSLLELTTRLSAYKAAKDSGIDPTEAAVLSRNVTVDFNKKGELTSMTNALYLFANAGTQGGFNMLKKVLTSSSGRKFMGAYVMAGFTSALYNTLMGPDDDDKDPDAIKNRYWALPEYQRSSALVLKNPFGNGFFKIPVGRALASPFFLGSEILGIAMGKVKTSDAIKDVAMNMLTSHNPLGGSEEVLQVISPTAADPLVQLYTNKNNFGSPIVKEQKYGTKKPASQSYFKNTNEFSIMATNWLNDVSGGSKAESGAIDISPNRIDWTAQTIGGGLANFVKNNILRFSTEITNKDMDGAVKDAPVLGRFYTTSKPVSSLSSIFQTLEKSGTEKISESDKKEFTNTLREARKSKEIDAADSKRYLRSLQKNQQRIDLARKHPDWDDEKLDRYFKRN